MSRIIEAENTTHAAAIARALLDAAGDDPGRVRTTSGPNGRQAFEVDDDFPEVTIPEAGPNDGDRRRHGPVIGDTQKSQEDPGPEQKGRPKKAAKSTAKTQE